MQIHEIKLSVGEDVAVIPDRILEKIGLDRNVWRVTEWEITRKSVDARDKRRIRFVYSVRFEVARERDTPAGIGDAGKTGGLHAPGGSGSPEADSDRTKRSSDSPRAGRAAESRKADAYASHCANRGSRRSNFRKSFSPASPRPVIAGFGPCGIFAAHALAKAGFCPIVLERGRPVEERQAHVTAFWKNGVLDENSNVFFGEGGAGTFSDGKLTTGIGDARKDFVRSVLAEAGGGDDLLRLSRPHVGTDVLRGVIRNLRNEIIDAGGEIRFGCKLVGVGTGADGGLETVIAEHVNKAERGDLEEIGTGHLILAIGHSARDTMRMLLEHGVGMEQKPFSVGVRIEHTQRMIDEGQYGRDFESIYGMDYRKAGLPPAEYKLSHRCGDGRGVYTFCMCPGGLVIAAASEPGGVCTNGMSARARDGFYANSGVLADVRTEDFGSAHPLAGIALQRRIEQAAFLSSPSVNGYVPLMESLGTFCGSDSALARCLPAFAVRDIREALPVFGRRIKGFDAEDALVYGPETRSSSPVRILRGADMQSSVKGLYPCGEGAGYAGGIVSAAVDGLKAAECVIDALQRTL